MAIFDGENNETLDETERRNIGSELTTLADQPLTISVVVGAAWIGRA
jgi:hypothetical protein